MLGINPDNRRSYRAIVLSLFGLLVFLNLTDLLSTAVALSAGLAEGNGVLVSVASRLDTSVVLAAGLFKAVFISAAAAAAVLGIRTSDRTVRVRVVFILLLLTVVFAAASANNIYLIGTSG